MNIGWEETNATINRIEEHTLLLMEDKVNMRFMMKQQLVGQEKKWNDVITIRINEIVHENNIKFK